jgi:hypothetical protein
MQAVASEKSVKKSKALKTLSEVIPGAAKIKGDPQMPRQPRLAKGIKVPRELKVLAALVNPLDRHAEKSMIRSSAKVIHENELRAKTRFKEKSAD